MLEAFHLGGWGMYPTLVSGVLFIAAATRYAVRPDRRSVPLQVSLGLITLLTGCLGFVTGMIKCFLAMESVPPDKKWIWMLGVGEALNCVGLALVLLVVGTLAAIVGAFRVSRGTPAAPVTPAPLRAT
jgi:hypothetical protein